VIHRPSQPVWQSEITEIAMFF